MDKVEQQVDHLIADLQANFDKRRDAVQALIEIGKPAVEPTIQAMNVDNVFAKMAAAAVLGGIKDQRALDVLIIALQDRHQGVRNAVTNALAAIGDIRAVVALQGTAKEEEPWPIHPSAIALKRLGVIYTPSSTISAYNVISHRTDSIKPIETQSKKMAMSSAQITSTGNNPAHEVLVEPQDKSWIPRIHISGYHEPGSGSGSPANAWIPSIHISGSFIINPPMLAGLARAGYNKRYNAEEDLDDIIDNEDGDDNKYILLLIHSTCYPSFVC